MCGCFEISDFVCFFTFFITTIVALLFVNYFFVYLDSEVDEKTKMFYFGRCLYFFLLTFLGCLVFAGVQRRSIFLLKWPSRFLVTLLIVGIISLTIFLWVLDRNYKQTVRDLEGKTLKFTVAIFLVCFYSIGIQRLISEINLPRRINRQRVSTDSFNNSVYIFDQSDQENHPENLLKMFRSKQMKKTGKGSSEKSTREINVASNGINYYQLLLEGSIQTSKSCSEKEHEKIIHRSSSITEV